MAFFAGASNVAIHGGSFINNVGPGNVTINDRSQHTNNMNSNNRSTSNMFNSHNDNSTRLSGSGGEIPSMPPRSAGLDYTQPPPPPQRPQRPYSLPQIPSTSNGGTAINLNAFNAENTDINNVFNNNSRNYYKSAPDNINNGPTGMSGPYQGLPSTSGPQRSGQFQAPAQPPFNPQRMGGGGSPGQQMSVIGANIQQMDQHLGEDFGKQLKATISQSLLAAGISSGNYDPQVANSSSSRNVEGGDSINTGMANLSIKDSQPQFPTHLPPTSYLSNPHVGLLTDQISSSNPSTSNASPYNIAHQQGSHINPSLVPRMNEPDMANLFSPPTDIRPSYGNNSNRPPPPASTTPFNFPSPLNVGPNSNFHREDRSVHRTNIDSFNEDNSTLRDSYNDNSLVDSTGKSFATESNRKGGFLVPDVPRERRKKKNSRVKASPEPSNRVDEEPDETDEQIPTEESTDSLGKKKRRWHLFGGK